MIGRGGVAAGLPSGRARTGAAASPRTCVKNQKKAGARCAPARRPCSRNHPDGVLVGIFLPAVAPHERDSCLIPCPCPRGRGQARDMRWTRSLGPGEAVGRGAPSQRPAPAPGRRVRVCSGRRARAAAASDSGMPGRVGSTRTIAADGKDRGNAGAGLHPPWKKTKNGSGCPLPLHVPVCGLHGRRRPWSHQLKPAPAETLFSPPLNAPPSDTLARLPSARW